MTSWKFSDEETVKWFIKLHWRCYENEHPEFMTYYISRHSPTAQLQFKSELARVRFSYDITALSCEFITKLERFGDWLPQSLPRIVAKKLSKCELCQSEYCPGFMIKGGTL